MKITICAIGRLKIGPELGLWEKYSSRIRWPLKIIELEERKKASPSEIKRLEGVLLSKALVVALDQRGDSFSSQTFAAKMSLWNNQGQSLVFLIGGANGLEKCICDKAQMVLSFGKATWPHMLVRIMLIEQLYRTQEIIAGNPYHRD